MISRIHVGFVNNKIELLLLRCEFRHPELQLQGFFLHMTLETVGNVSLCSLKKGPLIPTN